MRWLSLNMPKFIDVKIHVEDVEHAFDVAYDPVDQYIYWADNVKHAIFRTKLNGSDASVVIPNIPSPEGLAIDWIARTIYWTERDEKRIEVAMLNGTQRKIIIDSLLDSPRAIAVDPLRGYNNIYLDIVVHAIFKRGLAKMINMLVQFYMNG